MGMILDNTNSENPLTAISEVHDAFRTKIRQNCSNYVIKFKWIKKYERDFAFHEYIKAANDAGLIGTWERLLMKTQKEIIKEFAEICDQWMLEKLAIFQLNAEIKKAFDLEWDLVGPKPDNLL
jgi:hypothetical protein